MLLGERLCLPQRAEEQQRSPGDSPARRLRPCPAAFSRPVTLCLFGHVFPFLFRARPSSSELILPREAGVRVAEPRGGRSPAPCLRAAQPETRRWSLREGHS